MLKNLREEFSKLHDEATALVEAAAKDNRELTDEERQENETRFSRMNQIKSIVDEHARFAALALAGAGIAGAVQTPKDAPGREEFERGRAEIDPAKIDRAEFSRAVRQWAQSGQIPEKFATITTATQSGILLPKSVVAPITPVGANAFREGFAAWGIPVMETVGDTSTINIPVLDPAAGGQVAENASSETENAPTLAESIVSTVKTYQSGSVYYSNLQLSATSFDLLQATVPMLEANKELGLESTIAAAMIGDAGITQSVTTSSATGFTFGDLVRLNNALPKRYQMFKVILLSASAFSAAESLTDEQGRPVMVPDAQNQSLKRIGGTPVFRSDYLETLAADNIVGLVFSLVGFHLRDAGTGLARYTQVPAKPNQTGLNVFAYHAYGYAPSAVAKLVTSIS
jgi:HK97 family phage major capsid protein